MGLNMPMNQPTVSTRRRFPRIEVSLSIEIKAECGLIFNAITKNISQTGLLIVTDRNQFEQLTVNQRLSEKSQLAEVTIKITLPMEDGASINIHTHCRLFQFRRISRDCYHIGLEYMALSESEYDELTRYIQGVITCGESRQLSQTSDMLLTVLGEHCKTI